MSGMQSLKGAMNVMLNNSLVSDGCTLWLGARHDRDGYGLIKVDGKIKRVHRVAWESENGPIPDGEKVRHTCPNRHCWNTAHLALGDEPEPEPVDESDLEAEIAEMQEMYESGSSLRAIADEFNVSVTAVRTLAKNWGRVRGAAH